MHPLMTRLDGLDALSIRHLIADVAPVTKYEGDFDYAMERVKVLTGRRLGVSVEEMDGHCRVERLVIARHCAMWIAYKELELAGTVLIARSFGNRNHATVLNGIQTHQVRMKHKKGFKKLVLDVTNKVKVELGINLVETKVLKR